MWKDFIYIKKNTLWVEEGIPEHKYGQGHPSGIWMTDGTPPGLLGHLVISHLLGTYALRSSGRHGVGPQEVSMFLLQAVPGAHTTLAQTPESSQQVSAGVPATI